MTDLNKLFDALFPICRSITGEGIRTSLQIIADHVPLEIHEVPTGTRVYDWTVPPEWKLNSAVLRRTNGEVVVTAEDSNLHVLNFSVPFSGRLTREELEPHLYSIPDRPKSIPYVTSYYKEKWGICLTHEQREELTDAEYEVEIDTEIKDGVLNYGELSLPGESDETVIITSYLCHPSLGNNELSGPLALIGLYERLKALPKRRFSYKFFLIPETIGSITLLATRRQELEKNLISGCVLTCLGGPWQEISFKQSRRAWLGNPGPFDRVAEELAKHDKDDFSLRPFDPTEGSDERQFCSPGVDWPMVQAAKTIYGQHPQYHTSDDNKDFASIASIDESIEKLFLFMQLAECAEYKVESKVQACEPQLGKRNLYPSVNSPTNRELSHDRSYDGREGLNTIMEVLSLADGQFNIIEISAKIEKPIMHVLQVMQRLLEAELIEFDSRN